MYQVVIVDDEPFVLEDLKKNPFLDGEYFEHRRKQHKKDKETAYLSSTAALSGYYAL